MLSFFTPEEVEVIKTVDVLDDLGEIEAQDVESEFVNVLVQPATTQDLGDVRINGDEVVFTLHFPKTYTTSLRDAKIVVRGIMCAVKGDPQPYTSENTPSVWNRTVEVVNVDG